MLDLFGMFYHNSTIHLFGTSGTNGAQAIANVSFQQTGENKG